MTSAVARSPHPAFPVLLAGTVGGVAMIPVGMLIRHAAGGTVNVYGELVVERLLGHVARWALFVEHMLVSWVLAIPLVLLAARLDRGIVAAGLAYGVAIWLVVNALALPWLFGRPTPWALGWPAIWPSLVVHAVYGLAAATALTPRNPRT